MEFLIIHSFCNYKTAIESKLICLFIVFKKKLIKWMIVIGEPANFTLQETLLIMPLPCTGMLSKLSSEPHRGSAVSRLKLENIVTKFWDKTSLQGSSDHHCFKTLLSTFFTTQRKVARRCLVFS